MPTYTYRCDTCQEMFEEHQAITAPALTQCPNCQGKLRRVITGGAGFIIKSPRQKLGERDAGCQFEQTGHTCCGRQERCQESPCGRESSGV